MKSKKTILLIFTTLLAVAVYYGMFSDKLYPVIDGKIYRSAQLSANTLERVITAKHIKTIVNLRGAQKDEKWYQQERQTAVENNVKLYSITLPDHDLPAYRALNVLVDILMTAAPPLLLHCRRGADRSGMASALALSMAENLSLNELKKQFSWRYGVVPYIGSIGPRLFSRYEKWLNQTAREHHRENLLFWIRNVYVDDHENLEYWIDTVNDRPFEYGRRWQVSLKKNSGDVELKGWAYDAQNKSLPKAFRIIIDGMTPAKASFRFKRPGVAEYLVLTSEDAGKTLLGWTTQIKREAFAAGCHRISVAFARGRMKQVHVPTNFQICTE